MKFFNFYLCILVCCLLFSCKDNGKGEGDPEGKDTIVVVNSSQVPQSQNIVEPQSPSNGALLLDISHSMKGYLDGVSSDFRGVISKYLLELKTKHHYLYGSTSNEVEKEEFERLLNDNGITWSKESQISKMVSYSKQILISGETDIVCIISDGIMSGSNEQIRSNREYNVVNREMLKNELSGIMKSLAQDYSVLIVRYESQFSGIYYCYDNIHQYQLNAVRPYYAIILGKWDKVKWIEKNLIENKGKSESIYRYTDMVMFGDCISYNKCKFSYKRGYRKATDGEYYLVNTSDSLAFVCNIESLEPFMISDSYIRDNLTLSNKSGNMVGYKKIPIDKYNTYIDTTNKKIIISFVDRATISSYISDNAIKFELKYQEPRWITEKSDDADLDINRNLLKKEQTFNLRYLIGGLESLRRSDYIIEQEMYFYKQ